MLMCNRDACELFVDCFSDSDFDWKECPRGSICGGFLAGSEKERRIWWNMMRDTKTRKSYDEEFGGE